MLWSKLLRDDPERLEIELAKVGTTLNDLVRDVRDVPELNEITAKMSREARELLALQYFGDQRHPQPQHRRDWVHAVSRGRATTRRTPDFGRLQQLRDDELDVDAPSDLAHEQTGFVLPVNLPRFRAGPHWPCTHTASFRAP